MSEKANALSLFAHLLARVELEPVAGQSGGALVVFGAAASAAAALAAETVRLAASGSCPVRGLQRWAAACQGRMRQPEHLQRQVSAFMAEFDARQAVAEREAREEVVDADGFTLVSRARGRRGASDGEVHVRAAQGRAKRARGTAQEAFYGLQKLRARRQAVQQLRAKFEADKKRLRQKKDRKSL